MLCDCSELRNQLARWNSISSEWNDTKSKEIETDYIELMQTGINNITDKLYEISDFVASVEDKLSNI